LLPVNDSLESVPGALPPEVHAQVCVGDVITRYARFGAGSGVPIVVLRNGVRAWDGIDAALATGRRVIVPEAPPPNGEFIRWICGFLDGIGLPPTALLAEGAFCLPALELALTDPERLTHLVLVPEELSQEPGITGHVGAEADTPSVPVLLLRRQLPLGEALARMENFTRDG
jgi:hypothetical protein